MNDFPWEYGQFGVFTFVIILVLIGSISSIIRTQSRNNTLKEIARSGQPIDPSVLDTFTKVSDEDSGGPGGLVVGGFITLAVAAALVVFGQRLAAIDNDPDDAKIFEAIAVFPGFIGGALIVVGLVSLLFSRGKKD